MRAISSLIKNSLHYCGVEVRLIRNIESSIRLAKQRAEIDKWRQIEKYGPGTILDLGANEGQFAALIRQACPDARIISFEPIRSCFLKLQQCHRTLGNCEAINCAIGDVNETTIMHLNDFTPSSSLLPMGEMHREEFPHTTRTISDSVQVRRLDDVCKELHVDLPLVIKVDVQGFEDRVIRGGEETFRKATAAVLELTNYPLYVGQSTFGQVHQQLTDLGFVYRGNIDQLLSPHDRRILQFDGLFENTALQS